MPVATTNGRLIDSNLFSNGTQVGVNVTSFQSTNPAFEVAGVVELSDRLILARAISAGGPAGQQTLLSLYWSGERSLLAFNYSTGKIVYQGPGGTQGLTLQTLNRSIDFDFLSTDPAYGLTFATTDPNSAGQNHVSLNTRFNGTGTYDAQSIKILDTASNVESNFFAGYLSASYKGTQTLKWRIRKDGKFYLGSDSFVLPTAKTPATAGATGTQGEIAWDANYMYVCVATDTWKRTAISTW